MIYSYLKITHSVVNFTPIWNSIIHQLIVLESCSNPEKSQQVFKPAVKKIFGFAFQVFFEWHHNYGRFLAILAHVTWLRAQLLDRSISLKFHWKLG